MSTRQEISKDLEFIWEIVKDLKDRGVWSDTNKAETMLSDWENDLSEKLNSGKFRNGDPFSEWVGVSVSPKTLKECPLFDLEKEGHPSTFADCAYIIRMEVYDGGEVFIIVDYEQLDAEFRPQDIAALCEIVSSLDGMAFKQEGKEA